MTVVRFIFFGSILILLSSGNNSTKAQEVQRVMNIPQVYVSNFYSNNGNTTIKLICTSTIKNQNPPAYIVDGKLLDRDISDLKPEDILRIEVLRRKKLNGFELPDEISGIVLITTKNEIKIK